MESITLTCQPRIAVGKEKAHKARKDGAILGVVYGHGIDGALPVSIETRDLDTALSSPKAHNALLNVVLGDKGYNALVRQIQRHPVSRRILHLDLVVPDPKKEVVATVPFTTSGKSVGVQTGGKMHLPYREVRVACTADRIPAVVDLDVTTMDHNDTIMASQLPLDEGVRPVFDRDYIIAKCMAPRTEAPTGRK